MLHVGDDNGCPADCGTALVGDCAEDASCGGLRRRWHGQQQQAAQGGKELNRHDVVPAASCGPTVTGWHETSSVDCVVRQPYHSMGNGVKENPPGHLDPSSHGWQVSRRRRTSAFITDHVGQTVLKETPSM